MLARLGLDAASLRARRIAASTRATPHAPRTSAPVPYARRVTETEPVPAAPTNVTSLVGEAMTKSGVIWVEVPGDRAWPVWHAWADGTAYVVNGPGEQHLPWVPPEVTLVLRSKDTGGRLLRVRARARLLHEDDPQWQPALDALVAGRLNAPGDALERWRNECAVTALTPFGNLVEGPGSYTDGSGAAPPPPSRATTVTWRPWHWRGRPKRRRGNPRP